MRILKCRLTTIEALLGTASNNKELPAFLACQHAAGGESGPCKQRGDCGGSCAGVFRSCDGGRAGTGGERMAELREAAGAGTMEKQRQGQIPL